MNKETVLLNKLLYNVIERDCVCDFELFKFLWLSL